MARVTDPRSWKNVLSKDFDEAERVLQILATGGSKRLQVIVDFDRTLSKAYLEDGTMCSGSHDVLAKGGLLPPSVNERFTQLFNKYYPIEKDPHKTLTEKLPAMVKWWTEAHDILVESKLKRDVIRDSVARSNLTLRDNCKDFFAKLHRWGIPCLIFSAGLGDVIEEVIRQQAFLYDNIHVISNYMDYDREGIICGFRGELIHVFNKNETVLSNFDYFDGNLCHRSNVMLLGDSLGDISMADGAADGSSILKIGFLNDRDLHITQKHLEAFDVVIDNDQTMEVPNLFLDFITSAEGNQENLIICT